MTGLDKAINAAGGKSRLALAIGIKPSSLSRWVGRYQGRVPAERVQQIFQLTGVTPHELRPDLHPNPTDGLCCGVPSAPDRQIAGGPARDERAGERIGSGERGGALCCYLKRTTGSTGARGYRGYRGAGTVCPRSPGVDSAA